MESPACHLVNFRQPSEILQQHVLYYDCSWCSRELWKSNVMNHSVLCVTQVTFHSLVNKIISKASEFFTNFLELFVCFYLPRVPVILELIVILCFLWLFLLSLCLISLPSHRKYTKMYIYSKKKLLSWNIFFNIEYFDKIKCITSISTPIVMNKMITEAWACVYFTSFTWVFRKP